MSEESLPKERKLEDIRKEAEERACALQKGIYLVEEFIAGPMCGKCFPCSFGSVEAAIRLKRIAEHSTGVGPDDVKALRRIGINMLEGSFCKKGKDVGRFILDIMTGSEKEIEQHLTGICSRKECLALVEYVIDPRLCTMCGKCSTACKHRAIWGEKRVAYLSGNMPFQIRQMRCTKCGECVKVCPTGAIEAVSVVMEEAVAE